MKFFDSHLDWFITLLLLVFSVIFLVISQPVPEPYKGLCINLSAGFIGSIGTIWGIEFLRRRQVAKKQSGARNVAREDMIFIRNMLISYISNPLDMRIDQYIVGADFSEESIEIATKHMLKSLVESDFSVILSKLTISQWKSFKLNLPTIRFDLSEKIKLYNNVLSQEIFGQLLVINKSFHTLYLGFGVFPELFTEEEANWPPNRRGIQRNRLIKKEWSKNLAIQLKSYFQEVNKLNTLLEETRF